MFSPRSDNHAEFTSSQPVVRVFLVVVALVATMCSWLVGTAQQASAMVSFGAVSMGVGDIATPVDASLMGTDDLARLPSMDYQRPILGGTYWTMNWGHLAATRRAGGLWRVADGGFGAATGVVTRVQASWQQQGGKWVVEIGATGRALVGGQGLTVMDARWRPAPIGVLNANTRAVLPDTDPENATMVHGAIYVVMWATGERVRTGALHTTLLNKNNRDNCWYYRDSLPPAADQGMGSVPMVFGPWKLLPFQLRDTSGNCGLGAMEALNAANQLAIRAWRVVTNALGWTNYQPTAADTGVASGSTQQGSVPLSGITAVGVADAAPLGYPGAAIVESSNGDLYRTDLRSDGTPSGTLTKLDVPGLPAGARIPRRRTTCCRR